MQFIGNYMICKSVNRQVRYLGGVQATGCSSAAARWEHLEKSELYGVASRRRSARLTHAIVLPTA